MRIILFYDLPTKTVQSQKSYNFFHGFLLKNGFYMMQYSIYVCLAKNLEFANVMTEKIRKNSPAHGDVRCLIITEKQYQNIKFFCGKKSFQEEMIDLNPVLEI